MFSHSVLSDSVIPWTAARQSLPSFTISWSLLKLMCIELMKREMSSPFSVQSAALHLPHGLLAWPLAPRALQPQQHFSRALLHHLLLDLRQASDTTPPSVAFLLPFLISEKCPASRARPRAFPSPSDPQSVRPSETARVSVSSRPPGTREHA